MKDNVTLPIQKLREAVSELIKLSDDKDIGQELMECNRRLGELKAEVAEFLGQTVESHVYWVERTGKAHKTVSLNAAPVDVADFLRRRFPGGLSALRGGVRPVCAARQARLSTRRAGDGLARGLAA